MSICRFWWDGSDVYVYESARGLECCGCKLSDQWVFQSEDEMVEHLHQHVDAGHIVPTYAFAAFDVQHPDAAKAIEAAAKWRAEHPQYDFLTQAQEPAT